jgi:hypothetical protein
LNSSNSLCAGHAARLRLPACSGAEFAVTGFAPGGVYGFEQFAKRGKIVFCASFSYPFAK